MVNPFPLIVIGAAVLLIGKRRSRSVKKSTSNSESIDVDKDDGCPDVFEWVATPQSFMSIDGSISKMLDSGERDPFNVADSVFASIVPETCSKSDYKSIMHITSPMPGIDGSDVNMINFAHFYGGLVLSVADGMFNKKLIDSEELDQTRSKVFDDYYKLTGDQYPDLDNVS